MSKGWESKNVEEQQAQSALPRTSERAESLVAAREKAEQQRKIHALELQRERVLSEKTSSPHRRSALQLALATIERDLQLLGWSIKL